MSLSLSMTTMAIKNNLYPNWGIINCYMCISEYTEYDKITLITLLSLWPRIFGYHLSNFWPGFHSCNFHNFSHLYKFWKVFCRFPDVLMDIYSATHKQHTNLLQFFKGGKGKAWDLVLPLSSPELRSEPEPMQTWQKFSHKFSSWKGLDLWTGPRFGWLVVFVVWFEPKYHTLACQYQWTPTVG
jgi:hypothetical protein